LHISEAYEHEPILPYQPEERCPSGSCNKVGTQSVDITQPLTLTPTADVDAATVTCQGPPVVSCQADSEGSSCTVTVTQRVSVSVPIRYSVDVDSAEPTIACAPSEGCACGL
jgi:hypothetical protein